jgi:hypothetical protein
MVENRLDREVKTSPASVRKAYDLQGHHRNVAAAVGKPLTRKKIRNKGRKERTESTWFLF